MTAKTAETVAADVARELGVDDLGAATLTVEPTSNASVWRFDYADSMTHDFGSIYYGPDDRYDIVLNRRSGSH